MRNEVPSPSPAIQTFIVIAVVLELIASRYVALLYTTYMLFLTAATAFGLFGKKAWLCVPFLLHMIARQAISLLLGTMFVRDAEARYAKVVTVFADATPIPQLANYYVSLTVMAYISASIINVILITCTWKVIQSFRSLDRNNKSRSIDQLFSFPRHNVGYSPI